METIEIADTVTFVDEESREHGCEISLTTDNVDDFQTVKCRSEYSVVSTCEEITDKASRTQWGKKNQSNRCEVGIREEIPGSGLGSLVSPFQSTRQ